MPCTTNLLPIDTSGFLRTMARGYGTSSPIQVTPDKNGTPPSIVSTGSQHVLPPRDHDDHDENRGDKNRAKVEASSSGPSTAEAWVRTILESDPSFLTPQTLILALQNNAPVQVIKFMLDLNPKVVGIPMSGPTPLQVAVRNDVSLEVIQLLLLVCPFGLCVTNADEPEDPLSFAKRYCRHRPGLIELLSRPLSYWVRQSREAAAESRLASNKSREDDMNILDSSVYSFPHTVTSPLMPSESPLSAQMVEDKIYDSCRPTSGVTKTEAGNVNAEQTTFTALIDREEIQNVKKLCSQLWKANKKMSKHIIACKNDLLTLQEKQIDQAELLLEVKEQVGDDRQDDESKELMHRNDILFQQFKEEQKHHFYRQLVALDMKEKAFKAQVLKTEAKILQAMDDKMRTWYQELEQLKETSKHQIKELQLVMENEVKVNAHFRTDLAEWLESQNDKENCQVPGFIFATNLGETREDVPLCDNAGSGTDRYHGELQTDTIDCTINKQTWRTFFKNRHQRILLLEDRDEMSPMTQ